MPKLHARQAASGKLLDLHRLNQLGQQTLLANSIYMHTGCRLQYPDVQLNNFGKSAGSLEGKPCECLAWLGLDGVEFNAPLDTIYVISHNIGHFGCGLHSQSLD